MASRITAKTVKAVGLLPRLESPEVKKEEKSCEAVFFIQDLPMPSFDVTNDIFDENAWGRNRLISILRPWI